MGLRNTFAVIFLVQLFALGEGFAQSSQYKRATKPKSEEPAALKLPEGEATKGKGAKSNSSRPADEKVDIKDLEDKYWMAKDTEFKVVQNRLYSKAERFNLSTHYGPIINDGFSIGNILNVGVGYYFNERWGVELNYANYMLKDSKMTSNFNSEFGATPDYNRFTSYTGVTAHWVPIYAKLSLFDQMILYFDFIISPGVGMMNYSQRVQGGDRQATSPVVNLDIAQQIYLSQHWALRVEMQNRFLTSEQVREYNHPENVQTTTQLSSSITVGFTYYFPGGKKGEE